MSSTPHSPPETPLKTTTAVINENLIPKPRPSDTPSRDSAKKTINETPLKEVEHLKSSPEIQAPTLPSNDIEDASVDKNVPQVQQIHSEPVSKAQTESTEEDPEVEMAVTEPDNPNAELSPIDWVDFKNRYREAIRKANDEEDRLLAEFEKYAEVGLAIMCYSWF